MTTLPHWRTRPHPLAPPHRQRAAWGLMARTVVDGFFLALFAAIATGCYYAIFDWPIDRVLQ